MKKNQVTIGDVYTAKVSGNLARIRITGENPNGGWDGLNLDTNRKVRIKTAGRLHRQIVDPDAAPPLRKADAQPEPQEAAQEAPEAAETCADEEAAAAAEPEFAADQPQEMESEVQHAATTDDDQEAATGANGGTGEDDDATTEETQLTKLSVPELQGLYRKVIQRETSSSNKAYLVWKLREAKKGRVPIGPRRQRTAGDSGNAKVLPLRMDTEIVAAWTRPASASASPAAWTSFAGPCTPTSRPRARPRSPPSSPPRRRCPLTTPSAL